MHCPACGVEAVEAGVFCHKCGHRLVDEDAGPGEAFRQAVAAGQTAQQPPEEEVWRGGYAPKAMLEAWALCGLFDVALLIAGALWVRGAVYWLILLAAMLAPWLYCLGLLLYRRLSVRYVLTTQRFLHESGILRRVNDRIEVLDMDDISFEQGIVERLIGVGMIRIASSDRSHPDFTLRGIDRVEQVAALFDSARMTERRRRGLHIEHI